MKLYHQKKYKKAKHIIQDESKNAAKDKAAV